jgi:hypothetical protein
VPTTGSDSSYNFILIVNTEIPQSSTLVITFPLEMKVSPNNGGGNTNLNVCESLFDKTISLTCLVGDVGGAVTLTVSGLFSKAVNKGQFGLVSGLIKNPETAGKTNAFKLEVFSPIPDVKAIADTSTSTPTASILQTIATCVPSCKTCAGTAETCTTCNSPSNSPIKSGSSCLSSCPDATFLLGQECFKCHEFCSSCYDYRSTNCLTCKTGYFFENGACLKECSPGTVVVNGKC